jgi:hypothetical protein
MFEIYMKGKELELENLYTRYNLIMDLVQHM